MTLTDEPPRLTRAALAMIVAWQRSAGSQEVCGLCAVDEFGRQHVLRLTNYAGLINAFEVSRAEEQILRTAAAQRGWTITAFVHTHPHHDPEMSPRDARCFEHDTLPWIIVGTATTVPRQRAYRRTPVQGAARSD